MIYLYLLGFLPSVVWLLFYLGKDRHPESNRMILKIFFFGMLSAFLAIVLEAGFQTITTFLKERKIIESMLLVFLGGALIEEYVKYFVVRLGVFGNRELDEAPDLLIYMIISALGFAALENILVLSNFHPFLTVTKALRTTGWRFVSATFLHALCSGLLGYFIALSFYHIRQRKRYFATGLVLSLTLHAFYNWFIMKEGNIKVWGPLIILIVLSCFVSYSFTKLKRLKSICQLTTKYG